MGNSIYGIAVSGMHAAQAGLLTTSHNIANVNTTGFTRQQTLQSAAIPNFSGSGYVGTGVSVDTVRRVYSDFLEAQVRDTQSQAAGSAELSSQLASIDNLLADPAAGLSPSLNDFFAGLQDLAAHPADAATRQTLVARADALAARFNNLDARLTEMRGGINGEIEAEAGTINAYTRRIADLNNRIQAALGAGSQGQAPNDLLDQRDALLRDLNREVGATAVAQGDGTINVYLGNRHALVIGGDSYVISASQDPESPRDTALFLGNGTAQMRLRPDDVGGGRLGGLMTFRDVDLAGARNSLGRIALAVAGDFNLQHQLGQDRSGAAGGAFFATGAPVAIARTTNAGNAQMSVAIADIGALGTSSYRVGYDGANYRVTRLSDGAVQTFASLPQTLDGITLAISSGAPAAGDSFLVEPTELAAAGFTALVRDPGRVAAGAPIAASVSPANTGSGTISAGSVNASLPLDANLRQTVTLTFTAAGTFDVAGTGTGNPTGVAFTAGATITYNGWSVVLSGTPAAGDTFTIAANTGGISDNRNASLLAGLQAGRSLEGGTASYTDAYGQLVSQVGNRAREMEVTAKAQASLAEQTGNRQQGVSGVNLDEEAANLMRFQQAYQASGKALSIANTMFDTLLEIAR